MDYISSGHLQRIDTLRGVAIAGVILFHFHYVEFGADEYKGFWIELSRAFTFLVAALSARIWLGWCLPVLRH